MYVLPGTAAASELNTGKRGHPAYLRRMPDTEE